MDIVFYDGTCSFCNWAVQWLLWADGRQRFVFAPLDGKTASELLDPAPSRDSLVLLEQSSGSCLMEGAAVLRICWLLGGPWAVPGLLHFLPSLPFDMAYRLVARNRYRLFSKDKSCRVPSDSTRFLD